MFHTAESQESALRRSGKKYATAYAANDVQGGTAVTRPPCRDDCWTSATMHMQKLATAIVKSMYLGSYQMCRHRCRGQKLTGNDSKLDDTG